MLTLSLELNGIQITEKEKYDKWNKELVESRIALEKEHFKKFVPAKKGLGYRGEASTSHDVQHSNVPPRTSVVHPDVKMQTLYRKLQGPLRKGIDFEKQKNFKPFCPGYSKYVDVPDHKICWHCGMSGHLRLLCPQREHLWGNVPSNMATTV